MKCDTFHDSAASTRLLAIKASRAFLIRRSNADRFSRERPQWHGVQSRRAPDTSRRALPRSPRKRVAGSRAVRENAAGRGNPPGQRCVVVPTCRCRSRPGQVERFWRHCACAPRPARSRAQGGRARLSTHSRRPNRQSRCGRHPKRCSAPCADRPRDRCAQERLGQRHRRLEIHVQHDTEFIARHLLQWANPPERARY